MSKKYLDYDGLVELVAEMEDRYVRFDTNAQNLDATEKANARLNIGVPTKTSDLTNDGDGTSNFATENYVAQNGGKIDVIKVNGTAQTITDKAVDISVPTNTNQLTNGAGFITKAVNDLTNYYTKTQIDGTISSVYKPAGSVAFAGLPTLAASVLGNVYNVTDAFTTTSDFVEGAGKSYPAGTNVVVISTGTNTYKFDILAGFVDLSNYQTLITASNKISADNVDDTNATNQFVTWAEKIMWNAKQAQLVSGTNIKTINGTSLLSGGDLDVHDIVELTGNTNIWELDIGIYKGKTDQLFYKPNTAITDATTTCLLLVENSAIAEGKRFVALYHVGLIWGLANSVASSATHANKYYANLLTTSDIVNNLTSTSTLGPLSANMGKTLKDTIDNMPDTAITTSEIEALFS